MEMLCDSVGIGIILHVMLSKFQAINVVCNSSDFPRDYIF